MQSVLEEFAQGNISPEPRFFKRNSEYGRAIQRLADSKEKLLSALDDSGTKLLNEITDAQANISHISNIDNFILGYKLGVLMTVEVFAGKEDLIIDREGH